MTEQKQRQGNACERGVIVNELKKKAEIVIFVGSNGSGKSIFTSLLKLRNWLKSREKNIAEYGRFLF